MPWDMDTLIKRATMLTVAIVAGIAAWISYTHIYVVGGHNPLLPISVDGMIVTSSLVLLTAHRSKLSKTLWLARFTLWLGISATLLANVDYGLSAGALSAVVSAWPAVCFVFTVETVMQLAKAQRIKQRATSGSGTLVLATQSPTETIAGRKVPNRSPAYAKPVQARTEPPIDVVEDAIVPLEGVRVPSIRKIRDQLGCGQPVATQIQQILKANPGMTVAKAAQIRERVKVDARKQRS